MTRHFANAPNYIAPCPTSEDIALDEDALTLALMFQRLKTTIDLANANKSLCSSQEARTVFEEVISGIEATIHNSCIAATLIEAKEASGAVQAYRENP